MKTDRRVDVYIEKSAAFARPILTHLRELVHRACPPAEETIKWGIPHFIIEGSILCSMAAFKSHCVFGFWRREMNGLLGPDGANAGKAMGHLGRIQSLQDLPSDDALLRYLRTAAELANRSKHHAVALDRKARTSVELSVPDDLAEALEREPAAAQRFAQFSPSHRKEYIQWITEAKRPETRARRVATTIERLLAGKTRNWEYERKPPASSAAL